MFAMKHFARVAVRLLAALAACEAWAAPDAKTAQAPKWTLKFTENFDAASLNE